jgi:hypothetical protein
MMDFSNDPDSTPDDDCIAWEEMFSLCREKNIPLTIEVGMARFKIFPSGAVKRLKPRMERSSPCCAV